MDKKDNIVRFPLGSSQDMGAGDMSVIEEVVREGIESVVVVGINCDGDLIVAFPPDMTSERAHFLLTKALRRLDDEPMELEWEDGDDEDDEEGSVSGTGKDTEGDK